MRRHRMVGLLLLLVAFVLGGIWLAVWSGSTPVVSTSDSANTADKSPGNDQPLSTDTKSINSSDPSPAPEPSSPLADQDAPDPETPPGPEPPAGLVIEGSVFDEFSSTSVAEALVQLQIPGLDNPPTATTDILGEFRIELSGPSELPKGSRAIVSADGYLPKEFGLSAGYNYFLLGRSARLVVSFPGADCVPESVWVRWLESAGSAQQGGNFDPVTRTCTIELQQTENVETDCVVCAQWFGQLIESTPLHIDWGTTAKVALKPPQGASVRVRVLGPDARGMAGVRISTAVKSAVSMLAVTDDEGKAEFRGLPSPARVEVRLIECSDGEVVAQPQFATIETPVDVMDMLFDLTGTGIVECDLTLNEEPLDWLHLRGPEGTAIEVWLYTASETKRLNRIYGLRPGTYRVAPEDWTVGRLPESEFEVRQPPIISHWQKQYAVRSVTVHVTGAPAGTAMKLDRWAPYTVPRGEINPDENGDFLVRNLGTGTTYIRVYGEGVASRILTLDKDTPDELTVDVVACGTLKLRPRDGNAIEVQLSGIEPKQPTRRIGAEDSKVQLPPGRYRVSGGYLDNAPWEPVDVTIVAGEETECLYGPEYTSVLVVRIRNRVQLWGGFMTILEDEEAVPSTRSQVTTGKGDERWEFRFQAEGKLAFQLELPGYEPVSKTFEVKRGEKASIEIELKRKQ